MFKKKYIRGIFDFPVKSLVCDNISEGKILKKVLFSKDNYVLKIYKLFIEHNKGFFTEEIANRLNLEIYTVRRALKLLYKVGLIKEYKKKYKKTIADYWEAEEIIQGFFLYFPTTKLNTVIMNKSKLNNDLSLIKNFKTIAEITSKIINLPWIMNKEINWKIFKDGIIKYHEKRKYIKLSDQIPSIVYKTLISANEDYLLETTDAYNKVLNTEINIFNHQMGKFKIVNAQINIKTLKKIFNDLEIGYSFKINFKDTKRLYACPSNKGKFMACFPFYIQNEKINNLKINFEISKRINLETLEIWFDHEKNTEINFQNFQNHLSKDLIIKNMKDFLKININNNFLYNKVNIIKILFKLEPKYRSDYKKWIITNKAESCPFCNYIPLEMI
ncbi:MAG: hypothetical protein ACTSPY_04025 [Candidatus Helarchaeota archaeon]